MLGRVEAGLVAVLTRWNMSLNVFFALGILVCDFLIYFLYQWMYGEKHRNRPRGRTMLNIKSPVVTHRYSSQESDDPRGFRGSYNEQLAYRRLTASFAQARARS